MKKILILLIISLMLFSGCAKDNETLSSESMIISSHMNIIEGKVIEINDNKNIIIEITKERGGYSIGNKLSISYFDYSISEFFPDKDPIVKHNQKLELDANISVQFFPQEVTKKDGLDHITTETIYTDIY